MTKIVQIKVSPLNAVPPVEVDLDELNQDMRAYLLEYALGVIAQRARNTVKDVGETEATAAARKAVEARARNEMPKAGGGGGPRLDAMEEECREAFVNWLIAKGWKKGAANKEAPKWRDFIVARIKDKGQQAALLDDIEAKAKAIVEARAKVNGTLPDVTLD